MRLRVFVYSGLRAFALVPSWLRASVPPCLRASVPPCLRASVPPCLRGEYAPARLQRVRLLLVVLLDMPVNLLREVEILVDVAAVRVVARADREILLLLKLHDLLP